MTISDLERGIARRFAIERGGFAACIMSSRAATSGSPRTKNSPCLSPNNVKVIRRLSNNMCANVACSMGASPKSTDCRGT